MYILYEFYINCCYIFLRPCFILQALPLVTLIVGRKNNTSTCHIITTCPFVDDPKEIKFPLPSEDNSDILKPDKPTWANYIKGVIANFKGLWKSYYLMFISKQLKYLWILHNWLHLNRFININCILYLYYSYYSIKILPKIKKKPF